MGAADFNSSCWRVSAVVRPIWSRTGSGICSFETKCRQFLPSSPYRVWCTSSASTGVDRRTVQLLVMLPRASTFIVHLVRTPILPLSPGRPIFSLIRRNISSFWDEYFISLMSSCDVDIASTRRLASACRSLSHSTRAFQNVVRLSRFKLLYALSNTRSLSTHVANSIEALSAKRVALSAKLVALSAKLVALSAKLVQR